MIGGRGGLAYLVRPDDVISGQPLISQWSFFYGGGYFSAKLGNVNVVFKDSTDDDSIESALFPHSKAERKGVFYYSLILLKEKIILLPKSLSV